MLDSFIGLAGTGGGQVSFLTWHLLVFYWPHFKRQCISQTLVCILQVGLGYSLSCCLRFPLWMTLWRWSLIAEAEHAFWVLYLWALWICLSSNSYHGNSDSLDLGDVWRYLSYSYVFCHSECHLKSFLLNLWTRKERLLLLLLLAISESEPLMNVIRQENKILSANTGKKFLLWWIWFNF